MDGNTLKREHQTDFNCNTGGGWDVCGCMIVRLSVSILVFISGLGFAADAKKRPSILVSLEATGSQFLRLLQQFCDARQQATCAATVQDAVIKA